MFSFVFVCRSIDASAQPEEGRVERLSLKLFQPRLIMIFTLALFVNMGVSSWETVVTPLAQQHFRWGVESNSIIFILSGAILFFSNIVLVRIATKLKVSDETGTVVSIMVATLGAVLLLIGGNDIAYFVLGNLLFTLGKVYRVANFLLLLGLLGHGRRGSVLIHSLFVFFIVGAAQVSFVL